jgi:hypothetical protein
LANFDFNPLDKLQLSLDLSYTLGTEEMDSFHPRIPAGNFAMDQSPSKAFYISYLSSDGGKTVDFSGFDDLSDLDYSIIDLTFTANLDINEHWGIYGVFNYTDFQDDESYVYGDLDGTFYSANIGIEYKF